MVELFKGTNELKEKMEGLKEIVNDIYKNQRMKLSDFENEAR